MPRKFLVTDTSTEIRIYEQTIVIPNDKILYDEDGKYDSYATRQLAEEMACDLEGGEWEETHSGDQIESEMEVEELELEKQEDVTRYVNGEKVNVKETA